MVVRFFTPRRTSARIKFSGIPHSPKPPIMMVAPSGISRMASSELATSLFIDQIVKQVRFHHGDTESQRKRTPKKRKLRDTLLNRAKTSSILSSPHLFLLRDSVSPW